MDTPDELSQEEQKRIKEEKEKEEEVKHNYEMWFKKNQKSIDQSERLKEKSDDYFETQFIFISSGTLLGSFYIIEKFFSDDFFSTEWKFVIVLSWIFVGASIVVNLFSHIKASHVHNDNFHEFCKYNPNADLINNRFKKIRDYNRASIGLYITGLLCFLIFFTRNFYLPPQKEDQSKEKQIINNYNYMYNTKDTPSGDTTKGTTGTTTTSKPSTTTIKPKQ